MTRPFMTEMARSAWCRREAFSALCVTLRMEERHLLIKKAPVFRSREVLGQGQHRPEHNVAVGVARPDVPLPIEEHEPLGPVAVRVLGLEDSDQKVSDGLVAAQRQEHLHRTLRNVTGTPAASRVLLEAARGEVMDQGVLDKPGQDFAKTGCPACQGTAGRRMEAETRGDVGPEARPVRPCSFNRLF